MSGPHTLIPSSSSIITALPPLAWPRWASDGLSGHFPTVYSHWYGCRYHKVLLSCRVSLNGWLVGFTSTDSSVPAPDVSPHGVYKVGQVHYFRLFSCIFDNGLAFGKGCSYGDIFSGSYAGKVQIDLVPLRPLALADIPRVPGLSRLPKRRSPLNGGLGLL